MASAVATVGPYGTLVAAARRFPAAPVLHIVPDTARAYGTEARRYTYAEALAQVDALAAVYRGAGYGVGHRVGLLLENRPEFFWHWLALNAVGASVVPINPQSRAGELEYLVEHSELVLAVVLAGRGADLRAAVRATNREVAVIAVDAFPASAAALAPPPFAARDRGPDRSSEAALLYTSGTTGRPKGCVLTNEYFLYAAEWYTTVGGLCEVRPGQERLITPLPMYHMNALACSSMAMLASGGCIVPLDRFHPNTWWHSVRDAEATIVHYLGVMPAMLMAQPPRPDDRMEHMRFGFGAGVSAAHHAAFESRFGFPLLEAWAMTETGNGAVMIANREPRKIGTACFGRADPRVVDYRIVDEQGRDVLPGEPGELWVRHAGHDPRHGFFREYLKDPEATAAAWEGGWFHTGDVVRIDADGDFHFVDRRKNVIRRSGENIAAVEVEAALLAHPAVRSVGVAAVPDEVRGDEVMACVVPREPPADDAAARALAADIVTHCLGRLAYYKAPGYVAFCDALPLTATEKIQRAGLKELALRLHATRAVDTRAMKKSRPA
jgi:acyl-CoA synthetase (AMP-forming)/AMP-acid ligase II